MIIPAFRSAGYIAETLKSAYGQTYSNLEVILVNDGSPDTRELLTAIAPWRPQLTYLEQENAGAGAARNAALAVARGEFVAFLDADDRWLPDLVGSQVRYLQQHPDCVMVYADARMTGDTPFAGRTFMDTTPSIGPVTFRSLLSQQCTVLTSSVVARRDAIDAVGRFDASMRRGQDFDLWIRLAHRGFRIAYQRVPLIERIVLPDGLSADPVTELERAVRALSSVSSKLLLDAGDRRLLERRVTQVGAALECERGKRCLRTSRFDAAKRHFQRSLALAPHWKLRLVLSVMSIAPRTFQRAYIRFRPPTAAETLAAQS